MDNHQCPRICPLCGAPVGLFNINFTEKLLMCEDPMCDFPFGYEELQIVTDESQLRDAVAWNGARSLPDTEMSSASSIVSTTAWADIEQLTRLYDSDSCTNDTKVYQQSQLAKKRNEKKKYDEEMAQNLNHIKKLNEELNKLNRNERYNQIEKDTLLENLLRLQKMSGKQMLKKEELENLQKKKEAELGMGELKININSVPNEIGVINIEICNIDNEINETERNGNEDIETTENKIQNNIEEDIPGNNNQTDNNDQNNETNIDTNIIEEIETKIIPNNKSKEIRTANKTKDGNFTININNVNDNLQNLEIMDEGVTEDNEVQASVNPGDSLQVVGSVQVLGLVEDFPLITLDELTSSVVSEGPVLHEAMIDEMQVIMMNEEVPEEVQVTVAEQQATVEDKMEVFADKEMQDTENRMQDTTENKMEVNTENKLQITTKEKIQSTAEKMPIIAENMNVTSEKEMQVTAEMFEVSTDIEMLADKEMQDTENRMQDTTENKMEVNTENKLQITTKEKIQSTAEKMPIIAENMNVTSEKEMQVTAEMLEVSTDIEMQVSPNEAKLSPGKNILYTVIVLAETPSSVEIQPTSEASPVEPITPTPKKKRGRPRKVPFVETRGSPRMVPFVETRDSPRKVPLVETRDSPRKVPFVKTRGRPRKVPFKETRGRPRKVPFVKTRGRPRKVPFKETRGRPRKVPFKETRGRPRKVPKDTIDILSNDEQTKQAEHNISKQNEQREQNEISHDTDMDNSLNIEPNDLGNSLEIDRTVSSNIEQNESIEHNDEMNTSAECSVVKVPKKRGRKKGQKGVKRIVTDIRRSNRLSGINT